MDACLPMNLAMPVTAPPESDDSALVRRASAGDMRAFELLYRKHVGRVYGAVLRIVGMNHARAEELTQEAFVRAWQKLAGFRFESAFSTWLYRLGVNTALMALRGAGDEHTVEDDVLELAAGGDVPFCAGERSDLERAVAALPPRARRARAARRRGVEARGNRPRTRHGRGLVKAQLHRARGLLRRTLGSAA